MVYTCLAASLQGFRPLHLCGFSLAPSACRAGVLSLNSNVSSKTLCRLSDHKKPCPHPSHYVCFARAFVLKLIESKLKALAAAAQHQSLISSWVENGSQWQKDAEPDKRKLWQPRPAGSQTPPVSLQATNEGDQGYSNRSREWGLVEVGVGDALAHHPRKPLRA